MAADEPGEVTKLIRRAESGDQVALTELVQSIEARLRAIVAAQLNGRKQQVSVTDVVQEANIKITSHIIEGTQELENSEHFFALMAKAMSRIVIDHLRRLNAEKRPDGLIRVPLDDLADVVAASSDETEVDVERVERCLEALREKDQRAHQIVYMHYFGGESNRDIAKELGLSVRTIEKDLTRARAFLRRCIEKQAS